MANPTGINQYSKGGGKRFGIASPSRVAAKAARKTLEIPKPLKASKGLRREISRRAFSYKFD